MTCGYTTSTRPFTLNMLRDPGCRWVKALSQTLRSSDSDASIAARNARDIAKERDLRDLVGFCLKHIWICDILRLLRMFRCRNGFWSRRISILGQYGSVGLSLHASPSTPPDLGKAFWTFAGQAWSRAAVQNKQQDSMESIIHSVSFRVNIDPENIIS